MTIKVHYGGHFAENGISQPFNHIINPSAVYYNGKTYVAWQGGDHTCDPYITYYDHDTDSWATSIVKVADNPLVADDDHGAPSLAIDNNGYLHVFYGCHGSPIKHAKSDSAEDISSWTVQSDFVSYATYPHPVAEGNNMYVFYRSTSNYWYYNKSTDNGGSWGSGNQITSLDSNYFGIHEFKNGRIHFSGCWLNSGDSKRYNYYYFYFNTSDSKFYNVTENELTTPISFSEMNSSCRILDSSSYQTNIGAVHADSNDYPWVIYPKETATGWSYYSVNWNGSSWTSPQEIMQTRTSTALNWDYADFIVHSTSNVDAYLVKHNTNLHGGDIEKWNWNGSDWSKNATVLSESGSGRPLNCPMIPFNFDSELKVVFCQIKVSDWTTTLKVYAYDGTNLVCKEFDSGEDVYLNQKCRTDFGDIRFTDNDGTTELGYWMEERVDSDYAVFRVQIADDLSSVDRTIYVYYGKSDATTTSNGDNTFEFFDDFPGSSLNTSKWTADSGLTYSVSNSKLNVTGCPTHWTEVFGFHSSWTVRQDKFSVTAKNVGWDDGNDDTALVLYGFLLTDGTTWNEPITEQVYDAWAGDSGSKYARIEASEYLSGYGTLPHSGTANFEIQKDQSNNVDILWDDGSIKTGSSTTTIDKLTLLVNKHSTQPFYDYVSIDLAYIRRYVDPEPSHGSWGSEETPPQEYVVDLTQSVPNSWSILTETNFGSTLGQAFSSGWSVLTETFFNLMPSQTLVTTATVLTEWNAITDLAQSIGNSWVILSQSSFNILPSLALTATYLVLVVSTFAVGLSQAIGSSWAILTRLTFGFLSSLGLSSSWDALTKWNAISLPSLSLSSSWTVEAIKLAGAQYIADLNQSLSTSWSILIQTTFKTLPAQIISSSWAILTEWSAIVGLDQNFNNSWAILAQSTLNVFPSLSFTTSWLVDAVKLAGAQYVADLTQSISSGWQVLTETMFHVIPTQSLTSTWAVLTVTTFGVLSSLSFTSSWIVEAVKLAGAQHFAELTQSISTTWSILIQSTFNVLPTSALTTAWQVLTLTTFNLLPSFSFSTSWIVEAVKLAGAQYFADLSQSITSSWGILTETFYNIIPTQTLTSTWSVLLTWTSNAFPTQSLSSSWTVLTTSTFSYLSSLGLTSSWVVEAVKLAGAYYIVDLAQSLTTTWNILTELGFNVVPSIGLSASWNITCQSTFNLATSFSSSFSWIVEAVKLAGAQHFADLTQSLSTSWNVARAWAATVAFPQTLSTSWQTLTEWAATLGVSQSLSTAWTILSGQSESVALSVSVATSWTVDIIKGVLTMSVDLTMNVITSWLVSTVHQIYVPTEASVLEMIVVFCTAIFFTILYMGKEKILWGLFAFASWLTVAFLWLFINPVAYTVAFLFLGIAIVILLTVILILFQQIQFRRKGEPEESDLD